MLSVSFYPKFITIQTVLKFTNCDESDLLNVVLKSGHIYKPFKFYLLFHISILSLSKTQLVLT